MIDTDTVKLDPEADPDRFYVRVIDPARRGTRPKVLVWTESPDFHYSDDHAALDLNKNQLELDDDPNNPNALISKSLILMSDNVDDDKAVDAKPDDALGDRTRKVQLGGAVMVQYLANAAAFWPLKVDASAQVPVRTKKPTVHVNVVILRNKNEADGGLPVIEQSAVEEDLTIAQERLAQVGVRLSWSAPFPIQDPPSGIAVPSVIQATTADDRVHADAQALITTFGTTSTTNDIHIFYANNVFDNVRAELVRGLAFFSAATNSSDGAFINNALISSSEKGPFTVAHELAHLLGNMGHIEEGVPNRVLNLMLTITGGANSFSATKRLRSEQETAIHNNQLTKLAP